MLIIQKSLFKETAKNELHDEKLKKRENERTYLKKHVLE